MQGILSGVQRAANKLGRLLDRAAASLFVHDNAPFLFFLTDWLLTLMSPAKQNATFDICSQSSHKPANVSVKSVVVANIITKTCLYNFDPFKPHIYIVKLGLLGYTLFFLFLLKNIDCGHSLEPPR